MTTIRQLIQTTSATANALFGKLVDTSVTAVKTRERLFGELREELELLANLDEQHLFPVLQKHKALKTLVRDSLAENTATRKLVTELENTPRDTEEFGVRVAHLQKIFQQHVRVGKNKRLPAILKTLTDEEARGVVEKIETQIAEVEEAKRAEADERRAEARHEREKLEAKKTILEAARRAETLQRRAVARQERQVADQTQVATETARTEAGAARSTAQQTEAVAQEAVHDGVDATSRPTNAAGEQAEHVLSSLLQQNQEMVWQATKNLQILMGSRDPLAADMNKISASYFDATQRRWETNLAGINTIFASRTLMELFDAQIALFRSHTTAIVGFPQWFRQG